MLSGLSLPMASITHVVKGIMSMWILHIVLENNSAMTSLLQKFSQYVCKYWFKIKDMLISARNFCYCALNDFNIITVWSALPV